MCKLAAKVHSILTHHTEQNLLTSLCMIDLDFFRPEKKNNNQLGIKKQTNVAVNHSPDAAYLIHCAQPRRTVTN